MEAGALRYRWQFELFLGNIPSKVRIVNMGHIPDHTSKEGDVVYKTKEELSYES